MKMCSWFRRRSLSRFPVKAEVYKSVDGKFYSRLIRFGHVIFNGTESFHNRQDADEALLSTLRAIQTGHYSMKSLKE